jgi:hypothetical protein
MARGVIGPVSPVVAPATVANFRSPATGTGVLL